MPSVVLCLALLQAVSQSPPSEQSPAAERPYRVTICLRVADNPALTPLFVTSIRRQVRDQMSHYFGRLADIAIASDDHWLIDDYRDEDASQPEWTPQLWLERAFPGKLFLVAIDLQGDSYRVSCRQLDGDTQLAGPVRARTTPDREWVGKAVCLAIRNNFALLAEVKPQPVKTEVRVEFRGAENPEQVLNLLGDRAVLQPYWVIQYRGGRIERRPVPRTLLTWSKAGGLYHAEVVSNFPDPWPQRALIARFEAVKLDTQTGRLRVRIVDSDSGEPVLNCSVAANDAGFERLQPGDALARPDRDGYVFSSRLFDGIAYVRVTHGGLVADVPLPITDAVAEHEIRIQHDKAAGQKNQFARDLRFLMQDVQMIQAIQSRSVASFNELNQNKRYEEALAQVRQALDFVAARLTPARANLLELQRRAEELSLAGDSLLQLAQKQFGDVDERHAELRDLQTTLEQAIATRDAQGRANVLIQLGQQAEGQGDIEEALARYELALAEQPNQPALRGRVDELKRIWTPTTAAHRRAQDFVYQRWAAAEVTQIEALLPQATEALNALKSAGDYPSAQKLVAVGDGHIGLLNNLIEQLAIRGGEQDAQESNRLAETIEKLADLQAAAADFIEQALDQAASPPEAAAPPTASPATAAPPEAAPASTPPAASPEPPLLNNLPEEEPLQE